MTESKVQIHNILMQIYNFDLDQKK